MKFKKVVIALLLIGCVCSVPGYRQIVDTAARLQTKGNAPLTMVIDAGHGGMDGGAVGAGGTKESDINLAIAEALQEAAAGYGIETTLTRTTQEGLYSKGGAGGKWSKVEDMKERKRIIEETDPDLTVSIHLNHFISDSAVCGAQVFYPGEGDADVRESSKALAEAVQSSLKESLQDSGDRPVLPKNGVYLLKNSERNMILIECGFLSNPVDLQKLKTPEYQQRIAVSVMKGIAEFYHIRRPERVEKGVIDSRTGS